MKICPDCHQIARKIPWHRTVTPKSQNGKFVQYQGWLLECGCIFDGEQLRYVDHELAKENEALLDEAWHKKYNEFYPWHKGPISRRAK